MYLGSAEKVFVRSRGVGRLIKVCILYNYALVCGECEDRGKYESNF